MAAQQSLQTRHSSILIATLGSEPQVVTAILDLLTKSGETITEVRVIHTTGKDAEISSAPEKLRSVFSQPPYVDRVSLTLLPIIGGGDRLLEDVDNPASTEAAFRFLYQQVRSAKLDGWRLHLAIAGGRKTMALFGMAAAQMLCDEDDHIWYLYSSGDFLSSRRMHPKSEDEAQLIPVPFMRWSDISPVWTGLKSVEDPFKAEAYIQNLQVNRQLDEIRSFVLGALTPAEARVVGLLVQEGLSDQEIAGRLHLSPRTVEQHLRAAYQKAANHWELEVIHRTQLVSLLSIYYQLK